MATEKETDVRMSFLDVFIGGGSGSARISLAPKSLGLSRPLTGPPYIQSMTVKRKVRAFAAAEWTMNLFDPSGNLQERIIEALYYGNTGEDGRVRYSFGYTTQSGIKVATPFVHGILNKLHPRPERSGTRLVINGVDLDFEIARVNIPISHVMPDPTKFNGAKLFSAWVQQAFSLAGAPVNISLPENGSLNNVDMSKYVKFASAETNYSGVMFRLHRLLTSPSTMDSLSMRDFFMIAEAYCAYAFPGKSIAMRIDGMDETGVPTVSLVSRASHGKTRVYVYGTQAKLQPTDFIRVSNFAPSLDPVTPRIFVRPEEPMVIQDRYTRKMTTISNNENDLSGVIVGSNLMTSKMGRTDIRSKSPSSGSHQQVGKGALLDSLAQALNHGDPSVVASIRDQVKATFRAWPLKARMTVEFPPLDLVPYSHLKLKVITDFGEDLVMSGRYLVQDTTYKVDQDTYNANVAVLKSGGKVAPGTPEEKRPALSTLALD